MSATALKAWMKRFNKNEVDVASATGFSPITITRYLNGKTVNRSTELAFQRLISQAEQAHSQKVAAG